MIKKTFQYLKRVLTKPEGLTLKDVGPVSRSFGLDRGTPIDRYYIEKFLQANKSVIKGKLLEIAESTFSQKFGAKDATYEVLHVTNDNPKATIIGDLTKPENLPGNLIDCFICTQTYNFIYQVKRAVEGSFQLLAPGGVLLATVSGISQISRYDADRWGDYWRFTPLSAQLLFEEVFGKGNVTIDVYGNCLAAVSFLRGISVEEINHAELDQKDRDYPLLIAVKAVKPLH